MSSMSKIFNLPGLRSSIRNGIYALNNRGGKTAHWRCTIPVNAHTKYFRNITTSAALFDETLIKMPALSPTMSSGTIVKWHKKEGDKVSAGDVLCEVQTDKAVMAFEFDDDGVLAKILIDENSNEISVGTLIAIVCGEGDDWKNVKVPEGTTASASAPSKEGTQEISSQAQSFDSGVSKIAPSARNLLHHYGIDSKQMKPSGFRGTLLKEDVLRFISDNKLSPKVVTELPVQPNTNSAKSDKKTLTPGKVPPSSFFIDIELTSMRRTIAKRLTESKSTIPHAYMTIRCFMDKLLKLRSELKDQGIQLSVNDMIVKACGLALKQVPEMNSQWDKNSNVAVCLPDVDISIAVATPSGLITPIIRNANRLTLAEINHISRGLITRAKDGKLLPDEFVGGSFSISNLGMFDVDYFTGVINPPQAAILAVGATKPIYVGDPDNYQLKSRMACSLSYDARVVDEEIVALFMEKIQNNLEEPNILLNSDGTSQRRLAALL